jgi:hypothetical protein
VYNQWRINKIEDHPKTKSMYVNVNDEKNVSVKNKKKESEKARRVQFSPFPLFFYLGCSLYHTITLNARLDGKNIHEEERE